MCDYLNLHQVSKNIHVLEPTGHYKTGISKNTHSHLHQMAHCLHTSNSEKGFVGGWWWAAAWGHKFRTRLYPTSVANALIKPITMLH